MKCIARSQIWSPVPEMCWQGPANLVTNLTTPAPRIIAFKEADVLLHFHFPPYLTHIHTHTHTHSHYLSLSLADWFSVTSAKMHKFSLKDCLYFVNNFSLSHTDSVTFLFTSMSFFDPSLPTSPLSDTHFPSLPLSLTPSVSSRVLKLMAYFDTRSRLSVSLSPSHLQWPVKNLIYVTGSALIIARKARA